MIQILDTWQTGYCAGSPMSQSFRAKATECFQYYYTEITKNYPKYKEVLNTPPVLFRIISGAFKTEKHIVNNYYSFSGSIKGVLYFAEKDRYLKNNISLIISKPRQALNFNLLAGYSMRYGRENEYVSKMDWKDIVVCKHFNNIQELKKYLIAWSD